MNLQPRSPFEGEPETTDRVDANGNLVITVDTRVVSPSDGMFFMLHVVFGGCAAGVAPICAAAALNDFGIILQVLGGCAAFGVAIVWFGLVLLLLSSRLRIEFTRDLISVKCGDVEFAIDRSQPHAFALEKMPARVLAYEAQRQEVWQKSDNPLAMVLGTPIPFNADSAVLAMRHYGQRIDVVPIYPLETAVSILERLQAIDTIIDSRVTPGRGKATKPHDDWGSQSGELPGSKKAKAERRSDPGRVRWWSGA